MSKILKINLWLFLISLNIHSADKDDSQNEENFTPTPDKQCVNKCGEEFTRVLYNKDLSSEEKEKFMQIYYKCLRSCFYKKASCPTNADPTPGEKN